ncbi:MAG: NAD-dependent epimerase [Alphaproteobacteria bacterium CG_4_9_14_3_um_filter_47_13]|nr:MAG: NAD-dependent epimerase [Alphaproteobacteria bacterium CG_4_9_14_3_um_filter_47_13]
MAKTEKGTVLVTGGCGFIGSHTADALTESGYKVRIFDRVSSPYLTEGQEMVTGDITDQDALIKAAQGCDYIYHFAGIADIEEAKARPLDTCRVNIQGTIHALEAARHVGAKRFIFASTVYVYSDRGAFYRVSKQACENYVESYETLYGLPFTILRYGSLYGRRAGRENGIYKLIQSGMEKGSIIYNGDPDSMREYIHVTDAARLSVDILGDDYKNRHMILTGNERLKVSDLMKMISEMMPNNPKTGFGDVTLAAHYAVTPYTYNPKVGHKLVRNDHIDLGQGILDCIAEWHEHQEIHTKKGANAG